MTRLTSEVRTELRQLADSMIIFYPSDEIIAFVQNLDYIVAKLHTEFSDGPEEHRYNIAEVFLSAFLSELKDRDFQIEPGTGYGYCKMKITAPDWYKDLPSTDRQPNA